MYKKAYQLNLFSSHSLNVTYEIKRHIRMALANTRLSRDEVVDEMNKIAVREGMRTTVSKAVLDGWCKDSDPSRLPSLPWLTIFCSILDTTAPIDVMLRPLGCRIVGPKESRTLKWAEAELEKKKAVKRARLALEVIDDGI